MSFSFLVDHLANPQVIYDGVEFASLPLEVAGLSDPLLLELYRPETRQWRHYFSTGELQQLKDLLALDFRFTVVGERAIFPAIQQDVELQPFLRGDREIVAAFSYEERSPGHYVAWLAAVLERPLDEGEFRRRVDTISRYWTD